MTAAADLRARRLAVGLTQERLAVMAGISAAALRRIERGEAKPQTTTLRAITAALALAEEHGPDAVWRVSGRAGKQAAGETRYAADETETALERHADGTPALTLVVCGSRRWLRDDNTTVELEPGESVEAAAEEWRKAVE